MGQLSKSKIDRIQKLRKKGYLQKEVAKMVGVNVKTVRTYDPVHRTSKSGAKPAREPEGNMLPASFYRDVRNLADWVTPLYLYVLDPDEIPCPHCLLPPSVLKKKPKTVILRRFENETKTQ